MTRELGIEKGIRPMSHRSTKIAKTALAVALLWVASPPHDIAGAAERRPHGVGAHQQGARPGPQVSQPLLTSIHHHQETPCLMREFSDVPCDASRRSRPA